MCMQYGILPNEYIFCRYVQISSFRSWRSLSQPTIQRASIETGAIRVRGWIGTSIEDFIRGTQRRQNKKREVRRNKFRCRRRKGQGRRQASSLWLSRTSAPEKISFFPSLQLGMRVIVLYKQCWYVSCKNMTNIYAQIWNTQPVRK